MSMFLRTSLICSHRTQEIAFPRSYISKLPGGRMDPRTHLRGPPDPPTGSPGPPYSCCTWEMHRSQNLLDPPLVLAKGGPDAIAESFYNSMKAQQQSGSQSNKNLARTKSNWCLPSLKLCDGIIQESVQTYSQNNDKVKGYRRHTSVSSKASNYSVSKVMNHIDSESGCCPFLADGDFLHSDSNDS